ncbi:Phosphotransferase enzyme [Exophiala xenobiotica]|nr:Phosphotransferase enzyme [Exophiala xenobiotica]
MGFARLSLLSVRPIRHILHKLQQIRFNPYLAPDLYSPTTGLWLWNELRKQQEHTQEFDLKALEHVLIKAAGSKTGATAVRFGKLAEGASNKVFLAVVGKQRLTVKIPDPVVPQRLVTASEVATLEFLRSELAVPVPKVFSWSDNSDNPVGCEYIIMEEAQGRALNTVWSRPGIPEKLAVVDEENLKTDFVIGARLAEKLHSHSITPTGNAC